MRAPPSTKALHTALLRWFARNGRDLPWRNTRNPYHIWISEVMLQQTQVDRVVEFYRRFLKKFLTVERLAKARWPQVLSLWRGLGYYGRARNLMRAAKAIVAEYGGRFPATVASLEALPGIGPYTARAIAVFASEAHELVLDTNTRRVLSRFFQLGEKAAPAFFERNAKAIVPRGKSWAFHQGLMDLGATVCTAKEPRCVVCPLKDSCALLQALAKEKDQGASLRLAASGAGGSPAPLRRLQRLRKAANSDAAHHPDPLPLRAARSAQFVDVAAAVIHRDGKLLITSRPRGHLKGYWEFPGGKRERGEDWRRCLKREIKEELGIEVAVRPHDWTADHAYPDRTVHIRFHRCSILKGTPKPNDGQRIRWVAPKELAQFRFPPADAQIIAKLARARFVDPHKKPGTP